MVNKTDFKKLVLSRPTPEEAAEKGLVAVHFAGCPGHAQIKLDLFVDFKSRYIWPKGPEPSQPEVVEPIPDQNPFNETDAITLENTIVENAINEADLVTFIRSTNPNYTFDEQTKRRNLFAASVSSSHVCFIGGDTALPAAIIINNNLAAQVSIVESLVTSPVTQRVNPRIEITSVETILAEKRKYDTIIIDERDQLEKAILTAMRLSNPGTTIVVNGVENPAVAAIWEKYVQMLDMEPSTDIKFKDSATQSVRVIR